MDNKFYRMISTIKKFINEAVIRLGQMLFVRQAAQPPIPPIAINE